MDHAVKTHGQRSESTCPDRRLHEATLDFICRGSNWNEEFDLVLQTQGGISITAAADGVTTVESTGCEVFVRSTLNPLPAGVLLERHSETPCLFCDGSDFS